MNASFSKRQIAQLKSLGVIDLQIEELYFALAAVEVAVSKKAARNDTLDLLNEIDTLSGDLSRKLSSIGKQIDPAHGLVGAMLQVSYFQQPTRPLCDVEIVPYILPRIEQLSECARHARTWVSSKPSRPSSGSPVPIGRIETALRHGWRRTHGTSVRTSDAPAVNQPPPFPATQCPSNNPKKAFRQIVTICYEAAGGTVEPEAAIKAFIKERKKKRQRFADDMDRDGKK